MPKGQPSDRRTWGFCTPKFSLLQPVVCVFTTEQGVTHRYEGIVMGVFIGDPSFFPGWWYKVLWQQIHKDCYTDRVSALDDVSEEDLEPFDRAYYYPEAES